MGTICSREPVILNNDKTNNPNDKDISQKNKNITIKSNRQFQIDTSNNNNQVLGHQRIKSSINQLSDSLLSPQTQAATENKPKNGHHHHSHSKSNSKSKSKNKYKECIINSPNDQSSRQSINQEFVHDNVNNEQQNQFVNNINSPINNDVQKRRDTYISTRCHITSKSKPIKAPNLPNQQIQKMNLIKKNNKDCEDQQLIEACLSQHFFTKSLEKKIIIEIVKEMSLYFIESNKEIYKTGTIGNNYYIIKSGTIEVNGKKLLKEGESFGELALIHETIRSSTVIAKTNCHLWVLERKNFRKIIDHITRKNYEENKNFLLSIPILSSIENTQRAKLISSLYKINYKKNEYIVKKGEPADCLYIIKSGLVDCCLNGTSFRKLKTGDFFGEKGILIDSTRTLDVMALSQTECFAISIATFKSMLGDNYRHLLYLNFIKSSFALSNLFKEFNLDLFNSNEIFNLFTSRNLKEGEIAYNKGYITSSKVVIVIDGNLVIDKGIKSISQEEINNIKKESEQALGSNSKFINNEGENENNENEANIQIVSFSSNSSSKEDDDDYNAKIINEINKKCLENDTDFEIDSPDIIVTSTKIISNQSCTSVNITDLICKRGGILYENDLYYNKKNQINYNLKAFPDCLLVEADTEKILNILGKSFQEITKTGNIIETLKKVNIFQSLSYNKLKVICSKIKIENYKKDNIIVKQGEKGDKFYIVNKGNIDLNSLDSGSNNKYIRTIPQNGYFGETSLLLHKPFSFTAYAKSDIVEIFYLTKSDFFSLIEENMKKFLIERIYLYDMTIELSDLELLCELGSGNFGHVFLVKNKKTDFKYALKSISKSQILFDKLQESIELEKKILLHMEHPFIVKLVKTFQDGQFLYLLLEYAKGSELFDVIRAIGLLNKAQTLFYSCSLMLALNYMHSKNYIYRDLKPENVIVCTNGYIKLIDFGTAKYITDRTNTVIGTPHYMAPEIILGEGYSFEVDYWSLGICMYEFICGYVPFGEEAREPMAIYLEIIKKEITFPEYVLDKGFIDLINKMLCKKCEGRLSDFNGIKNHMWFNGVMWDELANFNVEPVFYPKIKKRNKKDRMMVVDYMKNVQLNKIVCMFNDEKEKKEFETFCDNF